MYLFFVFTYLCTLQVVQIPVTRKTFPTTIVPNVLWTLLVLWMELVVFVKMVTIKVLLITPKYRLVMVSQICVSFLAFRWKGNSNQWALKVFPIYFWLVVIYFDLFDRVLSSKLMTSCNHGINYHWKWVVVSSCCVFVWQLIISKKHHIYYHTMVFEPVNLVGTGSVFSIKLSRPEPTTEPHIRSDPFITDRD
jgi:hypothetical protein